MKKFILAAIAGVSAFAMSAQGISFWDSGKPEQKVVFGARAGLNVSNISIDKEFGDTDSKIGFKVGVSVDLPIVNSFYLNSGLFYTTKGFKQEVEGEKTSVNAGYIELPIYASYRLNFAEASQLQINFGPYLACGVNGKAKFKDEDGEFKTDVFGSGEDNMGIKRFDFGFGVGAGYTFHKVYLGLEYQFGVINILDKKVYDGVSAKTGNFNISVGYNL